MSKGESWIHACSAFVCLSTHKLSQYSRRYHVSKRRIVPLPRFKADPIANPEALFKRGQVCKYAYISWGDTAFTASAHISWYWLCILKPHASIALSLTPLPKM